MLARADAVRVLYTARISRFLIKLNQEKFLHLLILPTVIYFIIFHYVPMYGIVVAFQDYSPLHGFWGSPWVGLAHFQDFFSSPYFWRLLRNTFLISLYSLIFGFPVPLIFALLLNETRHRLFKRVVQTVTYFPHFVSIVIVVGLMNIFLSSTNGLVNVALANLGHDPIDFLGDPHWFRFLYVSSGIWQQFGWGSIIYLAALSAVPLELYEAAAMDGASRFQQAIHISIPTILPTVILLLILSIGGLMSVGAEKIILLYSPRTYETGDVIASYVYRRSLLGGEFSFGAAVGLFNNIVNLALLIIANYIARKVTEFSLW